ncbi:cytochrome c [Akkermansiaceae bacterium]|nr:cytochrome c [bacterium]MDB4381325.1 cytochrome c [Akkermansiaceae bacterium]MDB4310910.1 cytochrome c [bacterium]MDB4619664.1 cytochrome c [Akkermansiaceae bacterium]MDB4692994.1 cytochrome c [Akkermansiaceae bacterium]
MKIRYSLVAAISLLSFGFAAAEENEKEPFAHFLEPGFPFCEITVDARQLGKGFPKDNLIPRGLVVRVANDSYIAYDTDLCRMAVAWSGGFLTEETLALKSYQQPKKKKGGGQKVLPTIIGKPISATGRYPGVQLGDQPKLEDPRPSEKPTKEVGRGALPKGQVRWVSSTVGVNRVQLSYEIGGVYIREVPSSPFEGVIGRYFQIAAHPETSLSIIIGNEHCQVIDLPMGCQIKKRDGINYLALEKADAPYEFLILQSLDSVKRTYSKDDMPKEWLGPPGHWPKNVITKGKVAADSADYVIDEIPLPLENPDCRNVRPIDIDFSDGYAVIVTFDGDLWKVTGLEGDLQKIEWQRLASGLHEPSAVRVKNGEIFVFGRNGITKVVPSKELLVFENVSSDFWQSADTRDFAHSLSITDDGTMFICKGGQQNDFPSKHSGRLLKIKDDKVSVFATGLRNAYVSLRPGTDELYASDQQGHWVPATPIHRIVKGGYYGFQPAAPWGVPEPEVTPPLCWIPHTIAGSGLGVLWTDQKRFGPLSDSLLYLDYRRPGILRTYLNDREGQAASILMSTEVDFPLLKGAVNPRDGQVYLLGFQIWSCNSEAIRGMARLRYTGKPSVLPTRVVAGKNAVTLKFDQPLDPTVGNITARRWNYLRSETYGSGHYQPDGKSGEELLPVSEVQFSADRRSVLIATPQLEKVDQLAVSYELKTASGDEIANSAYLTLHHTTSLDLKKEGFPDANLVKLAASSKQPKVVKEIVKPTIQRGAVVYKSIGCAACHSIDGTTKGRSGPSWKGLADSERELMDGSKVKVTTEYLRESILDPGAKVTKGYNPKDVGMPSYLGILPDSDVESLILYIQSLEE